MSSNTYIYALADPITFEVRYVGKANDPYKRYCKHLVDKSNTHKAKWIRKLLSQGLLPIRQILEECDECEWENKEKDWISFEKMIGNNLTNGTDGGDGFRGHHSEEFKIKASERAKKNHFGGWPKGKKHSESWKLAQKSNPKNKGQQSWNHGKKGISEKTRIKMQKAKKNFIPWNKGKSKNKGEQNGNK